MALSDPRTIFGIHSVAPYNRTTGEFYGIAKVLDNSSIAISSELIPLVGGSQRFPWAVETGPSSAEITLSVSQYDNFLLEIAYGKAPTANAAETTGSITALTNKNGTSLMSATTGIASVGITTGDHADLKFGKYVVLAATSSTVDVYMSSDIDFARGTDGSYINDSLKITSSPVAISTGSTVTIPTYGIEFVGGSGTIGMTAGATATFSVRPPNTSSMDVVIGGSSDVSPEIGMIIYAQKRGNESMFEVDVFKARISSLPLAFSKGEFGIAELTCQAYFDSTRNGVLSIRAIDPS
jgi:hypothetical protein